MKKRILVLCLALVLVLGLGLSAFAAVKLGDVDGDGRITAFDAQLIAEYRAGKRDLDDTQQEAAGDLSVQDVIDTVLTQEKEPVYTVADVMTEVPPEIQRLKDYAASIGAAGMYGNGFLPNYQQYVTVDNENKTVSFALKGIKNKPSCIEFYHEGYVIDTNAWVVSFDCDYELDASKPSVNGILNMYATADAENGVYFNILHKLTDPTFIRRQIWRDGGAIPASGVAGEQVYEIPSEDSWSGSFMMMFCNGSVYLFLKNDAGQYIMLSSYITDYKTCIPQLEVKQGMDLTLSNIYTTTDEAEVQALYTQLVKPENPKGEARLMFLSNSNIFVFNTPDTFARLAKNAGYYVQVNAVTMSGGGIHNFNESGLLHDQMINELRRGGYDQVYINGLSADTSSEERMEKVLGDAEILAATIRAEGETPAVYARPPRHLVDKDGDGVDETDVVVEEAKSFDAFYTEMAELLGTDICYVERAYAIAYQEDPELALSLWGYDNAHVSNEGAYLNGCVLFCHTFGVSCENVGDDFLDPELAAFLRDIADRVVLEGEMPNW